MELPFIKMQGLGNDFVVIDDSGAEPSSPTPLTTALAKEICDRRFGVGADQILWLRKPNSAEADVRMEILNADGSIAEMCGNGIRAVALYLHQHYSRKGKTKYAIETLGGMKRVSLNGEDVTVDMGQPMLGGGFPNLGEEILVAGQILRFYEVNVGNPHAVFFVDRVEEYPVEKLGSLIETHPRFPQRTNVEFVEVVRSETGAAQIKVRVWERGAGITLACGTGACAATVATLATGRVKGLVAVDLPGGRLQISWEGADHSVMMTGPAKEVFRGKYVVQ